MTTIFTILVALVVLAILIFVHELGHFLVAKAAGVGVIEFAIGFGKKVFSKKWGDTTYSLRAVPLGGYVRMVGDDPSFLEKSLDKENSEEVEDSEADADWVKAREEALRYDPQSWFLNKSLKAKSAIVIAGPLFNILFAAVLSIFIVGFYGKAIPVETPVIGAVAPDSPAERAGLLPGDYILSISGNNTSTWIEMSEMIADSGGKEIVLKIERVDQALLPSILEVPIVAESDSEMAVLLGTDRTREIFRIGVMPSLERVPASFGEALTLGVFRVVKTSEMIIRGLAGMIQGLISTRHLGGPIMIFQEASRSAQMGLEPLLSFTVFLSISLAILNLLPIPVLDGGHLVFFLIEGIKGSPISIRARMLANQVGMLFILALMAFAIGNDILRSFGI